MSGALTVTSFFMTKYYVHFNALSMIPIQWYTRIITPSHNTHPPTHRHWAYYCLSCALWILHLVITL